MLINNPKYQNFKFVLQLVKGLYWIYSLECFQQEWHFTSGVFPDSWQLLFISTPYLCDCFLLSLKQAFNFHCIHFSFLTRGLEVYACFYLSSSLPMSFPEMCLEERWGMQEETSVVRVNVSKCYFNVFDSSSLSDSDAEPWAGRTLWVQVVSSEPCVDRASGCSAFKPNTVGSFHHFFHLLMCEAAPALPTN